MKSKTKNPAPLRILLVDETFERAALLKHALQDNGYKIVAHVSSSADLNGLVEELRPDVIILDTESPDRDTLEHLCIISRDRPRPIVMFTDDGDREKIREAIQAGVSAYVVDGLSSERILPIVEVAIARFNTFQTMRKDLEKAENQLAERKEIERAKGILMKQRGWSEDEAYQAMRKMAMDKGIRLAEVARHLNEVVELLG
ncbi:MAG: ANTAR domain-containing protein [Sulfuricellaceae bacterium]|nr:ANTAR domain-containing protein [Sulfuricellaceae bacterium]